jgi:hypothetical protein
MAISVSLYIKGQKRLSEIQEVLNRSKTANIFKGPTEVEPGAFRLNYSIDVLDECESEISKITNRWWLEDHNKK